MLDWTCDKDKDLYRYFFFTLNMKDYFFAIRNVCLLCPLEWVIQYPSVQEAGVGCWGQSNGKISVNSLQRLALFGWRYIGLKRLSWTRIFLEHVEDKIFFVVGQMSFVLACSYKFD